MNQATDLAEEEPLAEEPREPRIDVLVVFVRFVLRFGFRRAPSRASHLPRVHVLQVVRGVHVGEIAHVPQRRPPRRRRERPGRDDARIRPFQTLALDKPAHDVLTRRLSRASPRVERAQVPRRRRRVRVELRERAASTTVTTVTTVVPVGFRGAAREKVVVGGSSERSLELARPRLGFRGVFRRGVRVDREASRVRVGDADELVHGVVEGRRDVPRLVRRAFAMRAPRHRVNLVFRQFRRGRLSEERAQRAVLPRRDSPPRVVARARVPREPGRRVWVFRGLGHLLDRGPADVVVVVDYPRQGRRRGGRESPRVARASDDQRAASHRTRYLPRRARVHQRGVQSPERGPPVATRRRRFFPSRVLELELEMRDEALSEPIGVGEVRRAGRPSSRSSPRPPARCPR